MFTVTFYSYKGGVGRTLALMNVANRLAALGKRVCILDFDLEAPGLDSFGLPHPKEPMAGVVEYITNFLHSGNLPDAHSYIYDISTPNGKGALYLVPAGKKDADYQRALSRLDWKILYRQRNGSLVVEALRRIIARDLAIDYLLIDSRTGLTDVAGICTVQLPDLDVLLFNLNDQNLNGTARVFKNIRANKLNRTIRTLLVASPIPEIPEFLQMRSSRFSQARKVIGSIPEVIIPYDPFVSLQETIVNEQQSKLLSKAYDDLTQKIIGQNEGDVLNLLSAAKEMLDAGEMQLADLKYQDLLAVHPKSSEAWLQYGRFARLNRDYPAAVSALKKSVELNNTDDTAKGELVLTQLQMGEIEEARQGYLALTEASDDVAMLNRISRVIADRGEASLALQGMTQVISRHPSAEMLWNKAEALTVLGEFGSASGLYKELSKAAPTALGAHFNAGYTAWKAHNPEWKIFFQKAILLFEASDYELRDGADAANVYGAIAFAYEVLGRKDEARACLLQAKQIASEGVRGSIFSFPEYKRLSAKRFIEGIEHRLSMLDDNDHADA